MKRFFLFVIFAAPLIFAGCSDNSGPGLSEVKRVEITGAGTEVAAMKNIPEMVEAAGTIKAANAGAVSSKVMGTVTAVFVKEGQRVTKGELLLTIDESDISQKVKAAEAAHREASFGLENARAQLANAEATYKRYSNLFDANAISRQEFENITLQRDGARLNASAMEEAVNRARAGVEEARVYSGYARVSAPFSGVVTEKKIDRGSMAAPGSPLVVVEDDSSFVLEADFDGRHMGAVKPGMELAVSAGNGKEYRARVTEAVPSIDAATRTFLVKASIRGEGLKTGLYAKVSVPVGQRRVLTVPASAIVEKGQLTGVYTVDEKGVVSYSLVRVGRSYADEVEVAAGLSEGDRVISTGAQRAVDGGFLKEGR